MEETAITAYGHPLAPFSSFKYLEIISSVLDDDLPVVVHNLRRAQEKWVRLTQVLGIER